MKTSLHSTRRRGFSLVEVLICCALFIPLACLAYTPATQVLEKQKHQDIVSNMQLLGTLFQQFMLNYSSNPDDSTAELVAESNPGLNFGALTGSSANPYFRQLLLAGQSIAEHRFYAPLEIQGIPLMRKGDSVVHGGKALEPGENAMAYVMRKGQTPQEKRAVVKTTDPLMICGVLPSSTPYPGNAISYDATSLDGEAFVLFGDVSVRRVNVSPGSAAPEIFSKTRRGLDTSERYIVLSPEL